MKYPNMIGLYSPVMGSGKTTIAEHLVDVHGYTLVKFAGPLKDMTRCLLTSMGFGDNMVEQMVEGDLKERVIPGLQVATPRHLMQTMGTDWGRECIQNDVWVRIAVEKSKRIIEDGGRVVIDDVRFPNEAIAVAGNSGKLVKVVRKSAAITAAHQSEGALDKAGFDVTLQNDGSIRELVTALEYILLMKGYD